MPNLQHSTHHPPWPQFERHTKTLCRPSRRKERKHKKRCGASGCNKKLTLTNTVVCDDCHMEVCLAHRYADAHHCTAASARTRSPAAAKASFLSRFVAPAPKRKPVARATAAARANKAAALARQRQRARKARQARERAVKKQQADPSNTLVGSAARRMRGTDRVGAQPAAAAAAAPASSSSGGAAVAAVPVPSSLLAGVGRGREVCPTCHARFEAVTDLVAHVESWHGAGSGSQPVPTPTAVARAPARATGSTPCPNCGAAFFDPVDLVTHCESGQCPRTRRQSSCLVS